MMICSDSLKPNFKRVMEKESSDDDIEVMDLNDL